MIRRTQRPAGSVLLALQRATHVTLHRSALALADLELTPAELNALANLDEHEGAGVGENAGSTVSELGTLMGIRPSTLTSVLDRLERRGLIVRRSRPGDRRAVVIELTAEGRRSATLVTRTLGEVEQAALRGVTRQDLVGFDAVVDALTTGRS